MKNVLLLLSSLLCCAACPAQEFAPPPPAPEDQPAAAEGAVPAAELAPAAPAAASGEILGMAYFPQGDVSHEYAASPEQREKLLPLLKAFAEKAAPADEEQDSEDCLLYAFGLMDENGEPLAIFEIFRGKRRVDGVLKACIIFVPDTSAEMESPDDELKLREYLMSPEDVELLCGICGFPKL